MKYSIYCLPFLLLWSCTSNSENTAASNETVIIDTITEEVVSPPSIEAKDITDEMIAAFLDSLEALSFEEMDDPNFYADSLLNAKITNVATKIISLKNLSWLKNNKPITKNYFSQLIDIEQLNIPNYIRYYSDEIQDTIITYKLKKLETMHEGAPLYAWFIGDANGYEWENDFFLIKKFKGKHWLIGPIHNYNRYGENIHSFKIENGQSIIYFKENLGSGSGIWQINDFFYHLDDLQLRPALNMLKRSTLSWPTKVNFNFERKIISTSPLKIKLNYFHEIIISDLGKNCDSISPYIRYLFLEEETTLNSSWNDSTSRINITFDENFTKHQLLTFTLASNEIYFLKAYLSSIRNRLNSSENCIIKSYLQEVIAHEIKYKNHSQ